MTKNEFKIGDVVRIKDSPQIEKEFNLPPLPDYLFRVEYIQDDKLTVASDYSNVRFIVDAEFFELVETPDRKTAFLTELQELLNRHNAFFIAHKTNMPVSVYFNDNEDDAPFASIGKEINEGCGVIVNADNIFDFNKE